MINHPVYIIVVLLLIEGFILTLTGRPVGKKIFKYLPSMFWIYFMPMLATTIGLLPDKNPSYDVISKWFLPAAMVLLLLSADIRGILHLGPTALGMMAVSVTGVMLGAITVAVIFHHRLPAEGWKGIGSLCASWIGGSANMIAVGKAVEIPESLMASIIVVDTIIPYFWMGLLIALSVCQRQFDRWNKSHRGLIDELAVRTASAGLTAGKKLTIGSVIWLAAAAIAGSYLAVTLGGYLPVIKNVISPAAYAIILATSIGVCLSFTPARKLESYGSNAIGYALLYLVLASIGAKTSLRQIDSVPIFLAAGVTWITIHAICLLIGARLLRAPMALAAAASQASIGGPASAPVVAGVYHPQLTPVGLLLAVLGNILGTFCGLLVGRICQLIW